MLRARIRTELLDKKEIIRRNIENLHGEIISCERL